MKQAKIILLTVAFVVSQLLSKSVYATQSQTTAAFSDNEPAWSPDDQTIAFSRSVDYGSDIWVMDVNTRAQVNLTKRCKKDVLCVEENFNPVWSHDGSDLAFVSSRSGNQDVWTMTKDGRELTNLTSDNPDHDIEPTWSPDGEYIAFASRLGVDSEFRDIRLVKLVDKSIINLTADTEYWYTSPTWSPDGRELAFISFSLDTSRSITGDVWLMEINSGILRNITNSDRDELAVAWSPSGTELLIQTVSDVWQLNLKTHTETNIIHAAPNTSLYSPRWLLDGTQIAYGWANEASSDIWIINLVQDQTSRVEYFQARTPRMASLHSTRLP